MIIFILLNFHVSLVMEAKLLLNTPDGCRIKECPLIKRSRLCNMHYNMSPALSRHRNINLATFGRRIVCLLSFLAPAVSGALGPAASVRSVSLGTQSGEGAPCLGTVPGQTQPLRAERCLPLNSHRDSGWSSDTEHGGGGRLRAVTSGPISLASGLLPQPGTAAWRGGFLCGQAKHSEPTEMRVWVFFLSWDSGRQFNSALLPMICFSGRNC